LKVGYFADGPWSHCALEKILGSPHFEISFICARFDNPDPYLKSKSLGKNIPFVVNENINSDVFLDFLNGFD
jgi:methionyl-tRNA formyltransferase